MGDSGVGGQTWQQSSHLLLYNKLWSQNGDYSGILLRLECLNRTIINRGDLFILLSEV